MRGPLDWELAFSRRHDVACGTGTAAVAAGAIVGPTGRVAGLDANPEILAVARRKSPDIDWHEGAAENLPFEDASFDAVISQFGFMFFEDRPRALSEMMRVLKTGGRLAAAVCGAVERSPGYAAFAALLDRLFGEEVGNAFRAPFVFGDAQELGRIAVAAGLAGASVEERNGTVRFQSITELVATERACVWTLGGILDQNQFDLLLRESEQALRPFAGTDGFVSFDMPALILTALKVGQDRPIFATMRATGPDGRRNTDQRSEAAARRARSAPAASIHPASRMPTSGGVLSVW